METLIFCAFSGILFLSGTPLRAADPGLFFYDHEKINSEIAELNQLEIYLRENPGILLADLIRNDSPGTSDQSLPSGMITSLALSGMIAEPPLGIPSYIWGCMFGVGGVAIVYFLTEEDRDETKKAFNGCITAGVVTLALYAVLFSTGILYY